MLIYKSFFLFFSKKFDICPYIFPNNHEIAMRPKIPKIIVVADIPASFGP